MTHRLGKLELNIEVAGAKNSAGFEWQKRSERFCRDFLLPALETALEQWSNEDQVLQIDKLEIDLGSLPAGTGWEQAAIARLLAALADQIEKQRSVATTASKSMWVLPKTVALFEQWLYFLEHGALPTAAAPVEESALHQTVLDTIASNAQAKQRMTSLLQRSARALHRLTAQHPASFLDQLSSACYGAMGAQWTDTRRLTILFFDFMHTKLKNNPIPGGAPVVVLTIQSRLAATFHAQLWPALIQARYSRLEFIPVFIHNLIVEALSAQEAQRMVQAIVENIEIRRIKGIPDEVHKALRQYYRATVDTAPPTVMLPDQAASTTGQSVTPLSQSTPPAPLSNPDHRIIAPDHVGPADTHAGTDITAPSAASPLYTQTTDAVNPASRPPTPAFPGSGTDRTSSGEITKPDNREVSSTRQVANNSPNFWYTNNAGLVLLHPFITPFLDKLGLLDAENKQFVHTRAQHQAVYCLHQLASGYSDAPEYELIIPKLLCGFTPEMALERTAVTPLPEALQEEADHLLKTVIQYWDKLGSTSPQGLREGFLKRPGKLVHRPYDGFELLVESQGIDVLLDYLPWGLSMIKLPWMQDLLHVAWHT